MQTTHHRAHEPQKQHSRESWLTERGRGIGNDLTNSINESLNMIDDDLTNRGAKFHQFLWRAPLVRTPSGVDG